MARINMNSDRNTELPTASSALLEGLRAKDDEAWSRIVHTYGTIVYRWSRLAGLGEADAADVVQDVFASVARGMAGFERQKEHGSFRSWLATITRNRVRDFFRKQAKQQQGRGGTAALLQLHDVEETLESSVCGDTARSAVVRNVMSAVQSEFEPKTWSAFWLTTVEGKTGSEVSEVTGLSVGSVYQAKSRCMRRLRQRLSELPE